jgi:hypothetical protein
MFGSRKTEAEMQVERQRKEEARQRQQAERDQRRREKEALRHERVARRAATTTLSELGVAIRDGNVYKNEMAVALGREGGTVLGPLAGAHAEVTGGRAGHRRGGGARTADAALATAVLGPVGLLAAASRKGTRGTAFVVFSDGKLHEKAITDQASLVRAQADAVRFNALADAEGRIQPNRT